MKRSLLVVSLLLFLFACNTETKKKDEKTVTVEPEEVNYQIEKFSTKYHLFGKDDKPFCSIYLTLPRITSGLDKETLDFVTQSVQKAFFSEANGGELLKEQFKIESELLLSEYRDLEKDFSEADESIASSFNWIYEHSVDFFDIGKRYITFRITKFQNTGGVHPKMRTHYYTLDLSAKQQMTLDHTFDMDEKKDIEAKILERIKNQFDTEEEFEMNIWAESLTLTDNFYLSDSSFTFYYNPHEIGPFSLGPVEVSFTAKELDAYLQHKL